MLTASVHLTLLLGIATGFPVGNGTGTTPPVDYAEVPGSRCSGPVGARAEDNRLNGLRCGDTGAGRLVWCYEDQAKKIDDRWWCQNDEGGRCTAGEFKNCKGQLLCGRFSPDAEDYLCCSGANVVDNQWWCQNGAGDPCSGGADNNCEGDLKCGRFSANEDSYQCCAQGKVSENGGAKTPRVAPAPTATT